MRDGSSHKPVTKCDWSRGTKCLRTPTPVTAVVVTVVVIILVAVVIGVVVVVVGLKLNQNAVLPWTVLMLRTPHYV